MYDNQSCSTTFSIIINPPVLSVIFPPGDLVK